MSVGLVVAVTVVAALLALLGAATTLARRRIGLLHLAGAGLLEALLLVQAGIAVAAMIGGELPEQTATFLGYQAGIVLMPVAGVLWARSERSRWAGTVLAVAALAVAAMDWRLLQLWTGSGG